MDGLKGYCCVCNLTSNTERQYLQKWFTNLCGTVWQRDQSYFTAFGMFHPLAVNENVLEDLTSNYRRVNDFWARGLADALWKVLCCRNWVFGPLKWGSRNQWCPKSVVALRDSPALQTCKQERAVCASVGCCSKLWNCFTGSVDVVCSKVKNSLIFSQSQSAPCVQEQQSNKSGIGSYQYSGDAVTEIPQ